ANGGRQHLRARHRERSDDPAWSETLACADAPCAGTGRSSDRPFGNSRRSASGRRGAVADDARSREVRLCHSSWEADEQSGADRSGAGGAKGGGQGECEPAKHAPDTVPKTRVAGAGAHTASSPSRTQGGCCCCMRASPSKRAARLACRAALQRKAPLRAGLLLSHLHPKPAALHSFLRTGVAPGGAVSNVTQYPNGGFPVIPPALSLPGPLGPRDDRGNLAGEPGLLGVEGHQATSACQRSDPRPAAPKKSPPWCRG